MSIGSDDSFDTSLAGGVADMLPMQASAADNDSSDDSWGDSEVSNDQVALTKLRGCSCSEMSGKEVQLKTSFFALCAAR